MTRHLNINQYDARCDWDNPVSITDADSANRLISCHKNLVDAQKARALLLYQPSKHKWADAELKRFPVGNKQEVLRSFADIQAQKHWTQYDKATYADMYDLIRSAFLCYYGILPGSDDVPYGPREQPDDNIAAPGPGRGPGPSVLTNIMLDGPQTDWDDEDDDIGHEAIEHEPVKRPGWPRRA